MDKISSLFDKILFSSSFILKKVNEGCGPLELSCFFSISESEALQLIEFVKIERKKQKKIIDFL